LSDSTVIRNVGVPVAHTQISVKSLIKGIDKLILNEEKIQADLENNWAVVAEAIQTILRREGFPKPYETLKELTRKNTHIDGKAISSFIDGLNVTVKVKAELKKITPSTYTGRFEM
jgi:adenylosuccinate lyase